MNSFRIAAAAAAVLISGTALAEDLVCTPMQREYVALLRQARPHGAAAIAQQLATAKADAESGNCHRFLFFGPPKSPACPSIDARIEQLEQQLPASGGIGVMAPSSPEEQKASLQAALGQNGCSVPSLSTAGRTLCVRTCDGYYFPISNSNSPRRVKADTAACQTMYGNPGLANLFVQRSDDVADARSIDGKRYDVVELGELSPEEVVTPGIFVDRVAHIPYATSEA